MAEIRDLQVHVNGEQTFFIQEHIITAYSARMKKMIKQEKRRTRIKNSCIEIDEFPGGPDGFELVSRFCYNSGRIEITVWNVSLLHCCAIFLGMTEKISAFNLLRQTEIFLEEMFYWSWDDILVSLKSCESFFAYADSCGLLQKLVCAVLEKIAQNSSMNITASSSSSSSSPESGLKPSKSRKEWWFDDMSKLPPKIIKKVVDNLGAYGTDNSSLILTRFLLHYLRSTVQRKCCTTAGMNSKSEYTVLADTAIHGVISVGSTAFSCRKLFWVLGIVSSFSLSKDCRVGLERLIGEMLDQATLDDLLVSGRDRGVYDVSQVIRLLRVFVNSEAVSTQKMKKVGRLIDKYLGEISPDHNLKMSKFLGVVESLPDSARDCFDGVYRALDIYLESHPTLSLEERSRLCRCLNYEKLTLEACKELAKNPRIPPNEAVQALISQHSRLPTGYKIPGKRNSQTVVPYIDGDDGFSEESKDMKLNLQKMQWRVVELEKVCKEMKGHMSRLSSYNRNLPRFC